MNDCLGYKLVVHVIVHRNPMSIINTLALRPNLLSSLILGVGNLG